MNNNQLKVDKIRDMAKDKKVVGAEGKLIELDTDALELFEHVDIGHGDESMACLPWKGALKEPRDHPPINPTKPDVTY